MSQVGGCGNREGEMVLAVLDGVGYMSRRWVRPALGHLLHTHKIPKYALSLCTIMHKQKHTPITLILPLELLPSLFQPSLVPPASNPSFKRIGPSLSSQAKQKPKYAVQKKPSTQKTKTKRRDHELPVFSSNSR